MSRPKIFRKRHHKHALGQAQVAVPPAVDGHHDAHTEDRARTTPVPVAMVRSTTGWQAPIRLQETAISSVLQPPALLGRVAITSQDECNHAVGPGCWQRRLAPC